MCYLFIGNNIGNISVLVTLLIRKFINKVTYQQLRKMGEITVLSKATTTSKSLRTTVPSGIVKQFKLKKGDKLEWEIKAESGKLVIVVKPLK